MNIEAGHPASPDHDANCLFCKIVAKKIPSRIVFEDQEIFAFHDIAPWAPVHFLIIPKMHIPSMAQLGAEHAELLGRMMTLACGGFQAGVSSACPCVPWAMRRRIAAKASVSAVANTSASVRPPRSLTHHHDNLTFARSVLH